MTVSHKRRLEDTIAALCDELKWSLRSFYAAKIMLETELRLIRTLFDTFYFSCLDQAGLILSRMVVAKVEAKDDVSINLQYLANQAENKPSLFRFAKPSEVKKLVNEQAQFLELHKPFIEILKDQRDQNLAHLDRRHVNDPNWRESQNQFDFAQAEKFYQDLTGIMATYYRLFHGGPIDFGNWESISQAEVKNLFEFYEAYQSKA